MKWRERRQGNTWYTGPAAGCTVYYASKAGVRYVVQAAWRHPMHRSGGTVWWLSDGAGNNASFATKDAALAEAERRAATRPEPNVPPIGERR